MPDQLLTVTVSPHIHSGETVKSIMRDVIIALIPMLAASVYFFGMQALTVTAVCVAACIASEAVMQKLMCRKITVSDGSALITGLLLGFCMPASSPWWLCVVGGVLAIVVGKQLFGGLGYNPFNPALVARGVLLVSWPVRMTTWPVPQPGLGLSIKALGCAAQGVTGATPLAEGLQTMPTYLHLFLGNVGGSLGETCKAAILIGAIYLLIRRHICWRIPLTFIGTVALFSYLRGDDALYQVLAGGLFLGAFFMATDMVTSPMTGKGKLIFGIGCGLVTSLIRFYGGTPEGVCYSILFMNCLAPIIEKYTMPRKFGYVGKSE